MRIVLQRVSSASVAINGQIVGAIKQGLCLLIGITHEDTEVEAQMMADKIAKLRVFSDEAGKMNKSIVDVDGAILAVSQFTLYGDCRKGNRPSFIQAAGKEKALPLYEAFLGFLRKNIHQVEAGEFGADMAVSLTNDGPVTLVLSS